MSDDQDKNVPSIGEGTEGPKVGQEGPSPATAAASPTTEADPEESALYRVVVNDEEQYSIWPAERDVPKGWREEGKCGTRKECLNHIKTVWTDMRPLSLRKRMDEARRDAARSQSEKQTSLNQQEDPRDDLIGFLMRGQHPVEASLRPERTVKLFQEAIDRNFVHVKFTDTRGGTDLGMKLDRQASDFTAARFEESSGRVHLEGDLSLNYVPLRCVADIDLATLAGTGYLRPSGDKEQAETADVVGSNGPRGRADT
jgi:uncharacterized protein YbdZ (MbtH family)